MQEVQTPLHRSHSTLPVLQIPDLRFVLLYTTSHHKLKNENSNGISHSAKNNYSRVSSASYMYSSGRKAKEVMMEPFLKNGAAATWHLPCLTLRRCHKNSRQNVRLHVTKQHKGTKNLLHFKSL